MPKWPEVPVASFSLTTHDHRPWPFISESDGKKGIRLIIAETNVKPRLVSLNQAVLKHESIYFSCHLDPLHRRRCFQHLESARVKISSVLEIAVQPVPQALGLTNIDNASASILELIATWLIGN